jgi:DNA-binding transcriptional ArsR family regulator
MRISPTPNATPPSTPPSSAGSREEDPAGGEQLIWRVLVPRLVHPARLRIVEALIERGGPMSAEELAKVVPLVEGNTDLVRYHAKAMMEAGALELVDSRQGHVGAEREEPVFYFALPK